MAGENGKGRSRGRFQLVEGVGYAYGFFKEVKDADGNDHPDVFLRAANIQNPGRKVLLSINNSSCTFRIRPSTDLRHSGKKEAYDVEDCSPRMPC